MFLGITAFADRRYSVLPRYRLMWMEVPYEAGEVKAVAYGRDVKSHPLCFGRAAVYLRLKPGVKATLKASASGVESAAVTL